MKLWIAPYGASKQSDGFLIKFQSDDFRAGYADCRPWPVFQDATVEQHIELLKNRKLNALLKRSIFFCTHRRGGARGKAQPLAQTSAVAQPLYVTRFGAPFIGRPITKDSRARLSHP